MTDTIDYNKKIHELFTTISDLDDLNMNIFDFFTKYPTKKTFRCPDGTIINMSPFEPAVDINSDFLPLKDGIPQGEEATRMIVKNVDSGIIIASPPGVNNTYFITRYGSPVSSNKCIRHYTDYHLDRFEEMRKILSLTVGPRKCYFEKFGCDDSTVKKLIVSDYDCEINCCVKHKSTALGLVKINIASILDIKLFVTDDIIFKYAFIKNNEKKSNLLKKIKNVLELAESGKLLNRQLDPDFVLYGIHYYSRFVNTKYIYGWALAYHNNDNRIAHIYLDEITNDSEVKNTIELFAYEIITAKYTNDLSCIKAFLRIPKKRQFTMLEKMFSKSYTLNIKGIIENDMIY